MAMSDAWFSFARSCITSKVLTRRKITISDFSYKNLGRSIADCTLLSSRFFRGSTHQFLCRDHQYDLVRFYCEQGPWSALQPRLLCQRSRIPLLLSAKVPALPGFSFLYGGLRSMLWLESPTRHYASSPVAYDRFNIHPSAS